MALYRLRTLVSAWIVCGLFFQPCNAAPVQLNLYMNLDARQFLISSNQKIVLVLPAPLSEGGTAVVAAITLQPLSDLTTLVFESDNVLYVSMGPAAPFGVLTMGVKEPIVFDHAYSFDGVQINGEAGGLSGYTSLYYDAKMGSRPVITGLAKFIYESGTEKPRTPLPINYYTLNLFETQYIDQPAPVAWAFVASNINAGSVLPLSLLKPVSSHPPKESLSLKSDSCFQISRYLEVELSSSNQTSIHFDSSINAFVAGPYPKSGWGF